MYILSPKTKTRIFLDNSLSSYEDRLAQVEQKVLNNPQMEQHLSNGFAHDDHYALKVLSNCATFLLRGQYQKNNIMTIEQVRKTRTTELPASCVKGNSEDLIFSTTNSLEEDQLSINAKPSFSHYEYESYEVANQKEPLTKNKIKRLIQKYKNTNMYKQERLYSSSSIQSYKQVEKKDGRYSYIDIKPVTVEGRNGLIDRSKVYLAKWCLVNIHNEFVFHDYTFYIKESVLQYRVINSSEQEDHYSNQAEMDKILCYYIPHEEKYYFFDQNMDPLPQSDIIKINKTI